MRVFATCFSRSIILTSTPIYGLQINQRYMLPSFLRSIQSNHPKPQTSKPLASSSELVIAQAIIDFISLPTDWTANHLKINNILTMPFLFKKEIKNTTKETKEGEAIGETLDEEKREKDGEDLQGIVGFGELELFDEGKSLGLHRCYSCIEIVKKEKRQEMKKHKTITMKERVPMMMTMVEMGFFSAVAEVSREAIAFGPFLFLFLSLARSRDDRK